MSKMRQFKIFIAYIGLGVIANLTAISIVFIYEAKGFSKTEVGILISTGFIGAFFQPLFGIITDHVKHPRRVNEFLLIGVIIAVLGIYFSERFEIVLLFSTLMSISRSSNISLLDVIASSLNEHDSKNFNYGFMRSGASLGFGTGVFFVLPALLFGGIDNLLIVVAFFSLITIFLLERIDDQYVYEDQERQPYLKSVKTFISNKIYLLIVIANVLFMGVSNIKLSYQNILLDNLDTQFIYIAVITFIMIIPELILMPRHKQLFSNVSLTTQLSLVIVIAIFNNVFLYFANSIVAVMIVASLHGLSMSVGIPAIIKYITITVPSNVLTTAMMTNTMIQSTGALLISTFLIVPVYTNYDVNAVFLCSTILTMLSFIPIFIIKFLEKKRAI